MMEGLDAILHRKPSTRLDRILAHPHRYIAQILYRLQPRIEPLSADTVGLPPGTNNANRIKVICISDTHNNQFQDLPDGDILVHAGDLTENGTIDELREAIDWLDSLPHKYKIVIAGNHERCLDPKYTSPSDTVDWKGLSYLQGSSIVLNIPGKSRSVKIYGNPSSPKHGTSTFQYPRSEDFWKNKVPDDVDILVTHAPPQHHLDNYVGCTSLLKEVWRVRPKLHIFGHIHTGRGKEVIEYDGFQKCYERLSEKENVILNIFLMLFYLVMKTFCSICGIRFKREQTILVNATMVTGHKNEPIASGSVPAVIYL
ncbi:hypothetical protein TWF281_009674 [Arthrobotrys megalospora]